MSLWSKKLKDYNFDLPQELIAQSPAPEREGSRLLLVRRYPDPGLPHFEDCDFKDLPQILEENDLDGACFLRNRSAVLPARFYATRDSGSRHEFVLVEEVELDVWKVLIRNSAKLNYPQKMRFDGFDDEFVVLDENTVDFRESEHRLNDILQKIGEMPLPPYIKERDRDRDEERYQSVWADFEHQKSVAAPTASLHFTEEMVSKLEEDGHCFADCLLHVGLGTFEPMRVEDIDDHEMQAERYFISAAEQQKLIKAQETFSPIIPIGSTALRTLESLNLDPNEPCEDRMAATNLYIKGDFKFLYADALMTNFHLPESSLFIMISSFAGSLGLAQEAYKHAIAKKYRFFSYGDTSLWI